MIKEIFGKVKIYRLHTRVDNRGSLAYVFDKNTVDLNAPFVSEKKTNV